MHVFVRNEMLFLSKEFRVPRNKATCNNHFLESLVCRSRHPDFREKNELTETRKLLGKTLNAVSARIILPDSVLLAEKSVKNSSAYYFGARMTFPKKKTVWVELYFALVFLEGSLKFFHILGYCKPGSAFFHERCNEYCHVFASPDINFEIIWEAHDIPH